MPPFEGPKPKTTKSELEKILKRSVSDVDIKHLEKVMGRSVSGVDLKHLGPIIAGIAGMAGPVNGKKKGKAIGGPIGYSQRWKTGRKG